MADAMIRSAGLQWSDVIASPTVVQPAPEPDPEPEPEDFVILNTWPGGWERAAKDVLRYGRHLCSKWEVDFLQGLHRFPPLSTKQAGVLQRLLTLCVQAGVMP
jgi:hypothetical protein